jgi:hypothetical protein
MMHRAMAKPRTEKQQPAKKPPAKKPVAESDGEDPAAAAADDAEARNSGWHSDRMDGAKKMPLLVTDKYAPMTLPRLRRFEPAEMKLDGTVIAIGKRRTGKSWAFRHIIHSLKEHFDAGICISQTDELNGFWRQYMPAKYIFNRFSPLILEAVFARQKAIMADTRLTEEQRERKARFFIILDDVISDPQIRYDPTIAELFVAGRHYKLFTMITTQYAKAVTPTLRSNADYVLILHNKQESQRESLWRDFADFMTKEGFYTLMDAYTEDNEILVVDTSEPTAKVWEILHWFKADDPGAFLLGNDEFWESSGGGGLVPSTDAMRPLRLKRPL